MPRTSKVKDTKGKKGTSLRREYLLWSLVVIIPVILRIILFFSTREDLFVWVRAAGDETEYHKWALHIASGNILRESAFFTTPLYAYFLAVVYYFINDDLLTVRCANLVFFCLTLCFISLSSKKLFKFPFSLIPPLITGISFPILFYESFAEKTSLVLFLSALSFYLLIRAMKTFSKQFMILSGISCGLTLLAHATLLPLLACVILSILILKRHDLKTAIVLILLFSASCLVGVLPASIHNYIASNDFVLIAWNGGQSFHTANHAQNKSGLYHAPPFVTKPELTYEELDYKKEAEKRNRRFMKPSELSRYWFRQGWKDIAADPALAVNRYLKRLLWSYHNVELADTRHPDFYKDRFPAFYRYLPGLGVVSALGISGIYFSKTVPAFLFMRLFVIAFPLFMASFFIYGRYRLPVIIPLLFLGTVTIEMLSARVVKKQYALLAAQLCLIFFIGMLLHGTVKEHTGTYDVTREVQNTAAGYDQEALRLEQEGKLDEAIMLYRYILRINPSLSAPHYKIGVALLKQGKRQEALKELTAATEINPTFSDAYNNIGIIHAMNNDYEKAIENYKKALSSDPDNSRIYNNLGAMYMLLGNQESAVHNFEKAIALDPLYESPKKNLQKILDANLKK